MTVVVAIVFLMLLLMALLLRLVYSETEIDFPSRPCRRRYSTWRTLMKTALQKGESRSALPRLH